VGHSKNMSKNIIMYLYWINNAVIEWISIKTDTYKNLIVFYRTK
jgi:hypothetical protein